MSYPKTKDKHIGIEIEFIGNRNAREVFDRMKMREISELGTDGSIHGINFTEEVGWELRVCVKTLGLKNALMRIDKFIKAINGRVNDSCGLHVHLDMRSFKANVAYDNLTTKQEEMFKSIPVTRKNNEFCIPSSKKKIKAISSFLKNKCKNSGSDSLKNSLVKLLESRGLTYTWEVNNFVATINDRNTIDTFIDYNDEPEHYDAISACPIYEDNYQTLEIRMHEGTIDTTEIYNWCKYLCDVAYRNKLSLTSSRYIKGRIKKHG